MADKEYPKARWFLIISKNGTPSIHYHSPPTMCGIRVFQGSGLAPELREMERVSKITITWKVP